MTRNLARTLLALAALLAVAAAAVLSHGSGPATAAESWIGSGSAAVPVSSSDPRPVAAVSEDLVVVGVAGLRWEDVQASPELTALLGEADVGSISVKAASQQTCPLDGWLTISAGTRAWATDPGTPCPARPAVHGDTVIGWPAFSDMQSTHHTGARLGRLGAGGNGLCGFGPGAAIAVASPDGTVGRPHKGGDAAPLGQPARWWPEFDPTVLSTCRAAIVDAGVLPPRGGRAQARQRLAELVEQIRGQDRPVLLVGIAEETAGARRETLPAIRVPATDGSPRWLTSGSTRRPGLIQLTDLTATLMAGHDDSAVVDGAPIRAEGGPHGDAAAVLADRMDTSQRFEHPPRVLVPVALILLAAQLVGLVWYALQRGRFRRLARRFFVVTLLAQGGFFAAVYLTGLLRWWRWPEPYLVLMLGALAISGAVAVGAYAGLRRRAMVGVAALVYVVLMIDGVLGTPLQVGSMFADGPVVGGRFFGFGNSTFAAFAAATLVTAAAAGQRLLSRSRRAAAAAVLAIGGAAVVVDGLPGWGTDFGGVIALTPAVLLLAWYTWRGRITLRAVAGLGLAGLAVVALLAIADYQRQVADRTHFGAFVARLLDGDVGDTFARKLSMSFDLLNSPGGWAMLAAVILAVLACLLPGRVPSEAYRRFVADVRLARPALLALALCGVLGMLVNDAGVTVPAIMTGFVLPLLVAYLVLDRPPASVPSDDSRADDSRAQELQTR